MNYKKILIILIFIEIILITTIYFLLINVCWNNDEINVWICINYLKKDNYIAYVIYEIIINLSRLTILWFILSLYKLIKNKFKIK